MKATARTERRNCLDCGYTTPPTSTAMAEYQLGRHSCAQQRERDRRAAAAAARKAASGPIRDCQHPIARHVHGTRAAYVLDRCRCRPCRDASAAAEAQRTRAILYGTWEPYVDADPVRQHIRALTAAGLGLKRIAAVSGVSHSTIGPIIYGRRNSDGTHRAPTKRLRRETADAILSVRADLEHLGERISVDGTVTRLRLRALVACGWSMTELGRRIGLLNIHRTIRGDFDNVYADTARAAKALYEQLWNVEPPTGAAATRARRMAAENGWQRPLDLDDDVLRDGFRLEIGDLVDLAPDEALVDDVVVDRLVAGVGWREIGATRADRVAAAEALYARYLRETANLGRADLADATRERTRVSDIERQLGLRIRRDFGLREEAVAS